MKQKNSKGCIWGMVAVAILWIMFWNISLDTHNTGLLLTMIGIAVVGIAVVALVVHVQDKRWNKLMTKVNHIKSKYPRAYQKFTQQPANRINENDPTKESLEKVAQRESSLWESEEAILVAEEVKRKKELEAKRKKWHEDAERIKKAFPDGYAKWESTHNKWPLAVTDLSISEAEVEIKTLDEQSKGEAWEKRQSDFFSKCLELSKQFLPSYGRYPYSIPFTKAYDHGKEIKGAYKIWQFFHHSMCLEDLDYSLLPSIKEQTSWLPGLRDKTLSYPTSVYEDIANFIKKIAESYCNEQGKTITVLFNYDKKWARGVLDHHYNPLQNIFSSEDYKNLVYCAETLDLDLLESIEIEDRFLPTDEVIVIFDIATENSELKKLCQRIISFDKTMRPVITYISLLKAYDKEEMTAIINKEKKKQAEIREAKQKEEKARENLVEAVSSWDVLTGGLRYSYLFNYYPTTCSFEATEEEWANRWLVWDFKNTPGKTSAADHQEAMVKAISMLKRKLLNTFDAESLKYLTLVCIPASSQEKTKARYEGFSDRICKELGMVNAYSHITVVTEKEERRSGGTSIDTNKLSFDEDFFKGRYVLLFDDIITRGDSMKTFKRKMESLGATVVGGLSLGKTKHERPVTPSPSDDLPF